MSSTQNPSLFSRVLSLFGMTERSETAENLEQAGNRDGALTMSEEPTSEEIERVAAEKTQSRSSDT